MIRAIVLNAADNVATLVDAGKAGDRVRLTGEKSGEVTLADEVAFGHKVAVRAIDKAEAVLKYGVAIGKAAKAISVGQHVHVHNVESLRGRGDLERS